MTIDMKRFSEMYDKIYQDLYDRKVDVRKYRKLLDGFDHLPISEMGLLAHFTKYREDYISSDREVVAFMIALRRYRNEAGHKARTFRDEDGNIIEEKELREQYAELVKEDAPEYDGVSFEQYIRNCLWKNDGTLTELKYSQSELEHMLEMMNEGYVYGEEITVRDTFFWWVMAKTHGSKGDYISWRHAGSSANDWNTEELEWVLKYIFRMTVKEFTNKYEARKE